MMEKRRDRGELAAYRFSQRLAQNCGQAFGHQAISASLLSEDSLFGAQSPRALY
jgi:hypothetical protein